MFNQKKNPQKSLAVLVTICTLFLSSLTSAGPFILDLTDADDHGFASAGVNNDGWLYMQRVLENLAPGVTNLSKTVVSLGVSSGESFNAASSSFSKSSLVGAGWNWVNIDGVTDLTNYFNGVGAVNVNNTGIIQIGSGFHAGGGITSAEIAVLNANATGIDAFLGAGGGLHSLAQGGTGQYGWLSTLLPGLTFTTSGGSGLALTADGLSAFPGLNDSDLSSGPFHGAWTGNLGGLDSLFTDSQGRVVGIGSAGGSVTNPGPGPAPVPEPGTLGLLGLGLLGLFVRRRSLI